MQTHPPTSGIGCVGTLHSAIQMAWIGALLRIATKYSTSFISTLRTLRLFAWLQNLNIGKFQILKIGYDYRMVKEQADRVSKTIIKLFQEARVVADGTNVFRFREAAITSKFWLFLIGTVAGEVGFAFADDAGNNLLVWMDVCLRGLRE